MNIVFLSHTAAGGVFRVGSHHLSRELQQRGHSVLHISTPISIAHRVRPRKSPETLRRIASSGTVHTDSDGVKHLIPRTVAPLGRLPRTFSALMARMDVGRWIRQSDELREADVIFVDQPLFIDHLRAMPRGRIIYRPTDAHFDPRSRTAELAVLDLATGIAATSRQTLDTVLASTSWVGPTTVIENGVEFERFYNFSESTSRSGVAYIGSLDKRFDWSLLRFLASKCDDVEFRIAGPIPDDAPSDLPPNVKMLGPIAYAEAPAFLNSARIGLLPLSPDPGNAGRSPMKYYEYLASGLNVVATDVPALSARKSDSVWLYTTKDDAVVALRDALGAPTPRTGPAIEEARANSWGVGAARLDEFAQLEDPQ